LFFPATEVLKGYLIVFNIPHGRAAGFPEDPDHTSNGCPLHPAESLTARPAHGCSEHLRPSSAGRRMHPWHCGFRASSRPVGSSKTALTTLTEGGEDLHLQRNGPR